MECFMSEVPIIWGSNCRNHLEANAPLWTKDMKYIWKAVWSLNVTNPVKIFIWHACNNLLPTRVNLFHKQVVTDSLIPNVLAVGEKRKIFNRQYGIAQVPGMFGEESPLVSRNAIIKGTLLCSCFNIACNNPGMTN
jgi:hypothetical protein